MSEAAVMVPTTIVPPDEEVARQVEQVSTTTHSNEPPIPVFNGLNAVEFADQLRMIVADAEMRAAAAKAAGDPSAERAARSTMKNGMNLLIQLQSMTQGIVDARALLTSQPTARQIAFPGRKAVVAELARKKMKGSKWAFLPPEMVLGAVTTVLGDSVPASDINELEARIVHWLAYGSYGLHGLKVAAFCSRLVAAARASVRCLTGQGRPDDKRARDAMRGVLAGFLEEARGNA